MNRQFVICLTKQCPDRHLVFIIPGTGLLKDSLFVITMDEHMDMTGSYQRSHGERQPLLKITRGCYPGDQVSMLCITIVTLSAREQ